MKSESMQQLIGIKRAVIALRIAVRHRLGATKPVFGDGLG